MNIKDNAVYEFTFAFPFPENTEGAQLVRLMRDVCEVNGLIGEPSKMGPHATILPPFFATEEEIKRYAMLTRFAWKLAKWEVRAEVLGLGIFPPPEADSSVSALYLSLKFDEEFREFVERHKTDSTFQYKFPPAQTSPVERPWVPHISLIEGDNLLEKAKPSLPRLSEYARGKSVVLTEPLFFRKNIVRGRKWWTQVLV